MQAVVPLAWVAWAAWLALVALVPLATPVASWVLPAEHTTRSQVLVMPAVQGCA